MSAGLLAGCTVMVVDTETTGFDPAKGDRIVQVACLPVVDGVPGEAWTSHVNPGRPIPPDASRVHGITDAHVRTAPTYAEIAPVLRERIGDHWLAFHNAHFDVPFLRHLFESTGVRPLTAPTLDTLGLARRLRPGRDNSLRALAPEVKMVQADGRHEAGSDTRITAALLGRFLAALQAAQPHEPLAQLAARSLDDSRRRPMR